MIKQEVRARAKALRRAMDREQIGHGMAQALFALPCWQQAQTVLAFAALPDEPDTLPILRKTLADDKRLLLPRVADAGRMDWVEISDLSLLQRGAYGILEPPADLPAVCPPEDALFLVPCLAVSPDGVRLGRGGGYYDRFLAHAKGNRLLLCPSALVLPEVPADDWDVRFAPEEILTEKGTLL